MHCKIFVQQNKVFISCFMNFVEIFARQSDTERKGVWWWGRSSNHWFTPQSPGLGQALLAGLPRGRQGTVVCRSPGVRREPVCSRVAGLGPPVWDAGLALPPGRPQRTLWGTPPLCALLTPGPWHLASPKASKGACGWGRGSHAPAGS